MTLSDTESTSLVRCFDAAFPPMDPPPGFGAALGYIGGPLAERAWSLAEWQRVGHLIQFPCYVPDLEDSPSDQANDAVQLARRLGWRYQRGIIGDLETEVNRAWWQVFAATILANGYVAVAYGSLSCLLQNAASCMWAADWNDIAAVPPGQAVWGSQYMANVAYQGTRLDLSVLHPELARLGGRGPREVTE
jgi:hypothetical protein